MFSSPVTTIIGIIIALCPVVGLFVPGLEQICKNVTTELVGLGFIVAADGVKKTPVGLKLFGLALLASIGITACSSLLSATSQIETTVANVTAGVYTITVTKDGQTLYTETWDCLTGQDGKLAGCHKR